MHCLTHRWASSSSAIFQTLWERVVVTAHDSPDLQFEHDAALSRANEMDGNKRNETIITITRFFKVLSCNKFHGLGQRSNSELSCLSSPVCPDDIRRLVSRRRKLLLRLSKQCRRSHTRLDKGHHSASRRNHIGLQTCSNNRSTCSSGPGALNNLEAQRWLPRTTSPHKQQ